MISKYANHETNGDVFFEGMREALDQNGADPEVTKESLKSVVANKDLSAVVAELVKCAEILENAGHPAVKKVDEVLRFVSEMLNK